MKGNERGFGQLHVASSNGLPTMLATWHSMTTSMLKSSHRSPLLLMPLGNDRICVDPTSCSDNQAKCDATSPAVCLAQTCYKLTCWIQHICLFLHHDAFPLPGYLLQTCNLPSSHYQPIHQSSYPAAHQATSPPVHRSISPTPNHPPRGVQFDRGSPAHASRHPRAPWRRRR